MTGKVAFLHYLLIKYYAHKPHTNTSTLSQQALEAGWGASQLGHPKLTVYVFSPSSARSSLNQKQRLLLRPHNMVEGLMLQSKALH